MQSWEQYQESGEIANMSIVPEIDVDDAAYVGDEDSGVYYTVAEHEGKWYMSAMVNCPHFNSYLYEDDGPFDSEQEAIDAGYYSALDWCIDNGVDY